MATFHFGTAPRQPRYGTRTPMKASPGKLALFGIILFLMGGIFTYVGAAQYKTDKNLKERGVKTEATVKEIEQKTERDSDGNYKTTYRPIVEYTDADGNAKEFRPNFWRSPSPYAVGMKVPFVYDPSDPTKAAIDSASERYLPIFIFLGFGVFMLLVGISMLYGAARAKREPPQPPAAMTGPAPQSPPPAPQQAPPTPPPAMPPGMPPTSMS